ncbi:hypothetical protein K7957_11080 [Sphingomonas yunnanensis]|uniref:hypothetical protein n=1 Tax=Sphingomonas yunnanensis TaxID=310400 RepID=UPI001CA61B10|nr:hypothetical protein [Sphingomonas yunnanensis]MBY9063473.1 hypothetical protein [Sphingomonas yunnanensis]
MARRPSRQPRSPAVWGARAALALAATALGYAATVRSIADAVRAQQPERGYALAPGDARVLANLAERWSGPDATAAQRARADVLARGALRRDPSAVSAVATLGLDAQIRGDTAAARRWFGYSEALSRRDLRTQLWLIEDKVARGDIAGALRHYDIALRTSRSAAGILFPVLGGAIADPTIRSALIRTMAGEPAWSPFFVADVATGDNDPRAVALLFQGLSSAGVKLDDRARSQVIARLVQNDAIDAAWAAYESMRPHARRTEARDPRFRAQLADPTPFDWQPVNDAGISVGIQRGEGGGVVDFVAPASVGGSLLRQFQWLPPGDYMLEGHSIDVNQPPQSQPYWTLTCGDGRELGRVEVPSSARANGRFSGRLTVPADCPTQNLSLNARPSDSVGGTVGQIDRLWLRPAARAAR